MTAASLPRPRTLLDPAEPTGPSSQLSLAFVLYLLFMVSWFLHVGSRLPVLGMFRVDLLLLCLITVLIATSSTSGQPGAKTNTRTNRLILILVAYALLSAPFVEWPGTVLKVGLPDYAKALIFYYFTSRLVTTEQRLAKLLLVFVLCQTFRVLEPLYLHVTQGYWGSAATMADYEMLLRLSGAPSDIVNPNGLAFIIVTVIPFFHYLWTMRRVGGLIYLLALPPFLYALSLTGSRSGIVALGVTFLTIWARSRHKMFLAAVAVATVVLAVSYMTPDQLDRYQSIFDSNTKNAQTAAGRVSGMEEDFNVAMRRPLFGYGLGASHEANFHYSGRNIPSHNLITQVLQELGIIGLAIFLSLLGTILTNVRGALRRFRHTPGSSELLVRLCRALEVWLVMNILFSLFSYGLASYEWYFIAGLAEVVTRLSTAQVGEVAVPSVPVVVGAAVRRPRGTTAALRSGARDAPAFR